MKSFNINKIKKEVITNGIVTVINWTMAPDGCRYLYFYCDNWEIITDKMMPIDDFRSTEHWQLAGIVNDVIMILIPGCQVKAWVYCEYFPPFREEKIYYVK